MTGRQLSGMAVTGSNGSAYDLSSNFKPERAEYGAMLPPEASNATLCLQPQEGTFPVCLHACMRFRAPERPQPKASVSSGIENPGLSESSAKQLLKTRLINYMQS